MINISKLWKFVNGYVILSLSGFNVDKIIDKAIRSNISIRNINKINNKCTLEIYPKDFYRFTRLARRYKCKTKIIHKNGLFRTLHKGIKNLCYPIGIVISILLIYFLTQRIWLIEIEGNTDISNYDILEFCSENNIYIGSNKNKLKAKQLAENLKIKYKNISWINISLKGSRVYIKLSEGIEESSDISNNIPSDLIANNDCQIISIVTNKGTPQVKANDIVKRGDILISSQLIQSGTEEIPITNKVCASGTVRGKVSRNYSFNVPYNKAVKSYTQKTKNKYSLKLINKLFKLDYTPKYINYDKATTVKQLSLGKNCPLPIIIYKDIYTEYVYTNTKLTKAEAEKEANIKITEHIISNYSTESDIISVDTNFKSDIDKLIVNATIISNENIGILSPIQEELH